MIIENETFEALQKPFANSCTLEERGLRFECGDRSNLGIQVKVWMRGRNEIGEHVWIIDGTYWIDPVRKSSRSVRPADVLNAYVKEQY